MKHYDEQEVIKELHKLVDKENDCFLCTHRDVCFVQQDIIEFYNKLFGKMRVLRSQKDPRLYSILEKFAALSCGRYVKR
ncbi:MAG: hypothetical protein GY861_22125 [bacterium]|nr:hypothetical protein [bacterium]